MKNKLFVFMATLMLLALFTAHADTHRWLSGKNGNFSTAANWMIKDGNTGVAPSSGDDVEVWFNTATAKNWLYVTNDLASSFNFGNIYFSACSMNVASNITLASGKRILVASSPSSPFATVVKDSGNWSIGQDFLVGGDNHTGVTGVFTNKSGNIIANSGFTYIGQGLSSTGELVNVKGTLQTMKMLVANQNANSRGTYIHENGTLNLTASGLGASVSCLEVGGVGYGRFIMNGGTFKYKHCMTLGSSSGSKGDMIIYGGTVTNLNDRGWVHIGWSGRGSLQVGGAAGKYAKFDTGGEDLLFGGWLSPDNETNKLTLCTGGTLHTRHIRYHNGNSGANKGIASFVFDGGTLQMYYDSSTQNIFNGDGSTWGNVNNLKTKLLPSVTENNGTIDTQGGDSVLTLPFTGPGKIIKTGNNTLTVSIAQQNKGGFEVNSGTLKFTATGNILGSSPLYVRSGTFSCTNATLASKVEVLEGAKLASTGTLTFNSQTSLKVGYHSLSSWSSDLSKISAKGISVNSAVVVPITFETPVQFNLGDTYTLIKDAGLSSVNNFSIVSAKAKGDDITSGVYLAVESGNLVLKRKPYFTIKVR